MINRRLIDRGDLIYEELFYEKEVDRSNVLLTGGLIIRCEIISQK